MKTIIQISDYVIFRIKSEDEESELSTLKHQKLLYYIHAWYLAFFKTAIADINFEAWIHGPVNREIYETYKDKKNLYSEMNLEDIQNRENSNQLDEHLKIHINTILDSYAKFTATQLELMTHQEDPWIEARKGYLPHERCYVNINNDRIMNYYSSRLTE